MHPAAPPRPRRLAVAALAGLVAGVAAWWFRAHVFGFDAGDFTWALRAARDLLAGRDPYAYPANVNAIPYPLPAALVALPLVGFPDTVAGGVFVGLSVTLLAYVSTRESWWPLLALASGPAFVALFVIQWTPLILAAAWLPALGGLLVAIKPQVALPVTLPRLTWPAVAVGAGATLLSLALYPTWPVVWLAQIGDYRRLVPVLLPGAGWLLAALLLPLLPRWRDPRVATLLLAAVLPSRWTYDALILAACCGDRRTLLVWTVASWGAVLLPVGDIQARVVVFCYLPAALLLLSSAPAAAGERRLLRPGR
jgi:hypothetical protein